MTEPTVGNVKLSDYLKLMKDIFPECELVTDDGLTLEFFYEDEQLIIRTPDRSEKAQAAVATLKQSGLSGVWRSLSRRPT